MYVDFDTLNDNSRVWVYQSSREFNAEEVKTIEAKLKDCVNDWTRHGDDLKASFKITLPAIVSIVVESSIVFSLKLLPFTI